MHQREKKSSHRTGEKQFLLFDLILQSHLSPQSQQDEHEEEEQRPQRWDGEQSEGFWVSHKRQARAVVGHLGHRDVEVVCHEAQDGENDKARVHAGGTVGYADDDAVSVWRRERRNICGWVKKQNSTPLEKKY